jgi:Flp pilus assembly protein TadG
MLGDAASPATRGVVMAVSGSGGRFQSKSERGQVVVLTVVALVVILGMAALAIDVGSWYQAKRHDQAVVDAAALAGAQALPDDPAQAVSLAVEYAGKNGVTLAPSEVNISSAVVSNDTIRVAAARPAPTFFAKVFGLNSVDIGASAAARSGLPAAARFVAPIVVPITNPNLQCTPPPCSDTTSIDLLDLHNPGSGNGAGSFALLDLIMNDGGSVGSGILADWMLHGDNDEMPLGVYEAAPSNKYNSSDFQQALADRVGTEVLFPVYQPPIIMSGSNAEFTIIGWVGFHIDAETTHGSGGTLTGHFTTYLAQGLPAVNPGSAGASLGVKVVALVE